ncbi:hypothetical protein DNU06_01900 [Putridiphycobacter roseus]|uniref:L,D-TPase catalytic domain-containing protein n=1 Tax=Putridiphycobacter roseus TaxID=2219161 RepID=A0A2W1NV07_9FLAO|nr:L,D-transpeptidase family protein [Putridiphycobacter roseus]PZE18608.1 hypothetical protein DNU06_01900 [Putridiphycobacter roseus]
MINKGLKYLVFILLTSIFVTLQGCKSEEELSVEQKVWLSEKLAAKIAANNFLPTLQNYPSQDSVFSFYKKNEFEPIWINDTTVNENGAAMINYLENAYDFGLLPNFYPIREIKNAMSDSLLDAEVLLTNSFFMFVRHLETGVVDKMEDTVLFNNYKSNFNFEAAALLKKLKEGEPLAKLIENVQPTGWEYTQLQKGLENYLDKAILDTVKIDKIPPYKEDSTKCYQAAKKALLQHHFITELEGNTDSLFLEKIKEFQLLNGLKPDAVVGRWTGKMLEKTNLDRFYKGMLSLEKWRWKSKDTIPANYIWVNLPSYTLKMVENHKIVSEHRVVIGSGVTQTPEFHAKMKRMVTNPFWYVPYSIASTEILAGIKKDTTYLNRRGYKIFREGAEVNAQNVDWSVVNNTNFRYHVRQDGGRGNSLGKIKFLFPNEHAVYIHDTPSKSLFWNDLRAYSHGCVRLHQPYVLAAKILDMDKSSVKSDSIESMILRGVKKVIELNTPIDVYLEYYTAVGDSLGKITFYPDIYGRDEKFITIFKQNSN